MWTETPVGFFPFIDKAGFMYKYEKKPILNMWSQRNRTKKNNGTFDMTKENPLGGENRVKKTFKNEKGEGNIDIPRVSYSG